MPALLDSRLRGNDERGSAGMTGEIVKKYMLRHLDRFLFVDKGFQRVVSGVDHVGTELKVIALWHRSISTAT
jgi:hypothetical protein